VASLAILAGRQRRISGLPNNRGGPSRAAQRSAERRARRVARYDQVVALRDARLTVVEIRRHTGLDRRTISTWLAAGRFPERQPRGVPPPRAVDPYRAIIQARLEAGSRTPVNWRGNFGRSAITAAPRPSGPTSLSPESWVVRNRN